MKIQLSEAMSKRVYTVTPDMSVMAAHEYLVERRVRHLVVITPERQVVGIMSDRDFQRAMQTNVNRSGAVHVVGEGFHPDHQVRDFMSWGVHTLHEKEGVKQAALKMLELKISSLVIVNDQQEVVGFMTTDDLLWVLTKIIEDDDDSAFLENLKAQILNSPLGSMMNSISQAGI